MKVKRVFSILLAVLLGLVGLGTAGLGTWLGLNHTDASPVLVGQPAAAREQAMLMLDKICAGDFESAGLLMQGTPSLGADRPAADEAGALIWEAFTRSLSYELVGECYATDSGVAQDVRFTCLDLDGVTSSLGQRSQALLQQRIAEAEDMSQVYDEENNFREDVVMEVLLEAVRSALEDAPLMTTQITVNMVYHQGQWWIVPDDAMLETISGGILG